MGQGTDNEAVRKAVCGYAGRHSRNNVKDRKGEVMKENRSRWVFIIVAVAFFGLLLGNFSVSRAQQPTVLKLAHQWVQGDIRDKWAQGFAAVVEAKSKGKIKFNVHPGGTLMKPTTQIDALRAGALDLCVWHLAYSSGQQPLLGLLDLPGVIAYPEKGLQIAHSEVGTKLNEAGEKLGMKIVSWGFMPTSIGSTKQMIKLPADVKGLKLRSGAKQPEQMFRAAGAAITHVTTPEVYMALQQGVLDAVQTADASFISFRMADVIKSLTISKQHSTLVVPIAIVISTVTFKKLSSEEQKIILDAGLEVEKSFLSDVKKQITELEKAFKDKGRDVYELSDKELAEWIALSRAAVWKPFTEQVKGSAELLATVEKISSGK